jgi:hypothetical protein
MPFAASRPDRDLLSRLPFGDDWLGLDDPSEIGACDPLDVRARMAMYRLLIERGNPHGALGARDQLNPFWGYASQLAWQHRSGRLGAGWTIDPASWWGASNYALSVVPYAAAAEIGVVPALRFEQPPPFYRRALALWRDTVRGMVGLRPGDDLEPMRFAVWRAHLESIESAVRVTERAYRELPADERRFASGWLRTVELFGAAAIRTDLERIAPFAGGALPPRILGEDDPLTDLGRHERGAVRSVHALAARPAWRWAIELRVWRRMMRTRAARDEAEVILAGLMGRGRDVWPARVRAIGYVALPARLLR